MTYPTRAMIPPLLEDFRKISQTTHDKQQFTTSNSSEEGEVKDTTRLFSSRDIAASLHKVTPVTAKREIRVCGGDITVRVWYASHVLGAGIWEVSVGPQRVVYSGDYNMVADRHLSAAYVPRLQPDLFVSETTYCTSTRGQRRSREREFLLKVHECVKRGGKVLIPVFALGRAQEVMLLIDSYWERMGLSVPVYYSKGLVTKANQNYTNYVGWMNQTVRETFTKAPVFDFRYIRPLDQKASLDALGPAVLFATPGMLHSGFSLEVFTKWCTSKANLVVFTGYCAPGTPGDELISGKRKITLHGGSTQLDVACDIDSISFSAHVDAKGIVKMIEMLAPKNVMLVHGEKTRMDFLRGKIEKELGIYCCNPPNGYEVSFASSLVIPAAIAAPIAQDVFVASGDGVEKDAPKATKKKKRPASFCGVAILDTAGAEGEPKKKVVRVLSRDAAGEMLGLLEHKVRHGVQLPREQASVEPAVAATVVLPAIAEALNNNDADSSVSVKEGYVENKVVRVEYFGIDRVFHVSWEAKDREAAEALVANVIEPLISGLTQHI